LSAARPPTLIRALEQIRRSMVGVRDAEQRLKRRLKALEELGNRLMSMSMEGLDLGPLVATIKPTRGKQILEVVKSVAARVRRVACGLGIVAGHAIHGVSWLMTCRGSC